MRKPLRDRLAANFVFDFYSGCWNWTGYKNNKKSPYGSLWINDKPKRAHRASYEFHRGPIPDGMHVLHSCDNTLCVNPAHLFVGTHDDNMADKAAKGRAPAGPGSPPGMRHGRAKLTDDDVRAIRDSSEKNAVLASRYGVSPGRISKIRLRQSWAHI